MLLYLVQHGQAKSEQDDPARPLTDRGVEDVQRVTAWLEPLRPAVPTVWHSRKKRAAQTAEILVAALAGPPKVIQRDGLAPKDDVAPVRKELAAAQDNVMIVGHMPFLSKLTSALVAGERIWEGFRRRGGTVAMLFWQQSLGEAVDAVLSPAPIHKHHGGMIEDCYCRPAGLYGRLCDAVGGRFKLRHYWGPFASTKAGDWIAAATATPATRQRLGAVA